MMKKRRRRKRGEKMCGCEGGGIWLVDWLIDGRRESVNKATLFGVVYLVSCL